jgi:hypothetical protein
MKNKILGMGGLKSLAVAAAACAFFASGSAQAAFENYVGSTMNRQAGDCCGFDFSLLHALDYQYGSNGGINNGVSGSVQRDLAQTPFAFRFNDSDSNGLDVGDTLEVLQNSISLGNIAGRPVTLTLGTTGAADNILTVGAFHTATPGGTPGSQWDSNEQFQTTATGSSTGIPTNTIGGQINFTISTTGGLSYGGVFNFDDVMGYDGPNNGILQEANGNIATWLWGASVERICQWDTGLSPDGCNGNTGMVAGVNTDNIVEFAEELFDPNCTPNAAVGCGTHNYKKQRIGIDLAFHGGPIPGIPGLPEPGTLVVFGAGLLGMGIARRRKAKADK